ncbi:MAG: hypothetical protein PHS46_08620 [Candidatus Omnitrophica bacterium]|nr:hypothetical protein [Candidatus Omnitrophota bacterium]
MKKLPFLYEKVRSFLESAEQKKIDRDAMRAELASKFRISRGDTNEVLKEMQQFGAIKKRTRQKIEL